MRALAPSVKHYAEQLESIRVEMDAHVTKLREENPEISLRQSVPGQVFHNVGNALQVLFGMAARKSVPAHQTIEALERYAANLEEVEAGFDKEKNPSAILKSLCAELRNNPA